MKFTYQILVAVVLATAVVAGGAAVAVADDEQVPGDPVNYYGDAVADDGVLAPDGTTIVAVVDGEVQDQITVDTPGEYGGDGAFDDKLTVGSDAGDEVRFHVGDADGPEAIESPVDLDAPEDDEGVQEQLLTFEAGTFDADDAPSVDDVVLSLDDDEIQIGQQTDATVQAFLDEEVDGSTVRVVTHDVVESLDPTIATVDEQTVTAEADGTATLEAEYAGVTDDDELTVVDPAPFFEIDVTDIPDDVVKGEEITVEYEVENIGVESGEQDVEFNVSGENEDTEPNVELDDGETFQDEFTYTTDGDDVGELDIELLTNNDTADETVTVFEESNFNVEIEEIPDNVTTGQTLLVDANITNTGEAVDTQDINLSVDDHLDEEDVVVDNESVTLDDGETEIVTLAWSTDGVDTGDDISVTVESDDDDDSADIDIEEAVDPFFAVTIDEIDEEVVDGDEITVDYEVNNTGVGEDTQNISFEVDGEQQDTQEVEDLSDDDDAFEGEFTYETDSEDIPEVDITLASENDTAVESVTVLEDAFFEVVIDDVADTGVLASLDDVEVDATITNTGEIEDTQDIGLSVDTDPDGDTFDFDKEDVDTEEITLDGDEEETVTLTYNTELGDDPEIAVEVASDDDSATDTATVEEPDDPFYEVSITGLSSTVEEGEDIEIEYEVENTGDLDGDAQDIEFNVSGETEETESGVELDAGETFENDFTYETDQDDIGDLDIELSTDNDTAETTVTVLEEADIGIDSFEVDNIDIENDENATVGQQIRFTAIIENDGGVGATAEVDFDVDESTEDDASRYVSGGEQVEFDFSYVPVDDDIQEDLPFKLDLVDDGDETIEIDIEDSEADFNIDDVEVETPRDGDEVASGERVTISATIDNNDGTGDGSRLVEIKADNGDTRIANSTEVELDENEEGELSLTDLVPTDDEGQAVTYTIDAVDDTESTDPVDVLESPEFEVDDVEQFPDPDDVVADEEDIEINATIENTGDIEANQSVRLLLDGNVIDEQDIEQLGGGDDEEVTLSSEADEDDIGEDQDLRVRTSDDSEVDDITVLAPSEVVIDVDEINEPAAGDDLEVTIDYENVGDVDIDQGSQTITLSDGDLGSDAATVTPDGGAGGSETLSLNTEENDADEYEILITSVSPDGDLDDFDSAEATVLEPADIDVSIESITNPVRAEEETVDVEAEIENTGEAETTVDVDFDVDDDTEETEEDVTIDGGQTEVVTFDTFEPDEATEELSIDVVADGDDIDEASAEREIEVLEPFDDPLFRVSSLDIGDETPREDVVLRDTGDDDEDLTATVDVENIGNLEGTQTIEFLIGESVEDTEELTLDGDEDDDVSFSVDPDALRSGDRSVTIASDDSSQGTSIFVRDFEDPTFEVELDDDLDDELDGTDEVEANVTNVGDVSASPDVLLEIAVDDETIATEDFDSQLDPDEQVTIDLEVPDDDSIPRAGEVDGEVSITSDDDADEESVTVDLGDIQDAIDAAGPDDVVDVASGTYQEDITVDSTVQVDASGATLDSDGGTPITLEAGASGTVLSGFEIRNTETETGIEIETDDVTITQSVFRSSADDALNVSGSEVTIENNRFVDNQRAINLTNADGTTIRQNDILGSEDRAINSTDSVMTVDRNNIESDNVAIDADGGFLDATNNWWGRPGGPAGDEILSPVEFDPWLTDGEELPDVQFDETDVGDIGEVVEGDIQTVDTIIVNEGGTLGVTEGEVELTLDGNELDSFEFDAEDPEGEELEIDIDSATAAAIDEGTLEISISLDGSEQDAETEEVDVFTAPDFEVEITDPTSSTEFESDETLSVDAEVENVGQATGQVTAELLFDGESSDTDTVTVDGEGETGEGEEETVTLTRALDDGDVGSDISVEVDVAPGDQDDIDVTVTEAPEVPDDDDDDDDTTPVSGTSGVSVDDDDDDVEDDPEDEPDIEDVTDEVEQAEPDVDTERVIEDADPDTPGVSVDVSDETETVESITFADEETTGSVSVREYSDESVVETTSQSLSAQLDQDVQAVGSVADITVADDEGEPAPDTAATVTMGIDIDNIEDPDNVVINHETDDGWEQLETSVEEVTDDRVRVSGDVDGFSLFAVAEVEPDEEEEVEEEEPVDEEDPDDGIGTTGLIGLVVAIALVIAAAVAYRQINDGGNNDGL